MELRWEEDPIVEAVALEESGFRLEARALLGDLLNHDLRCLDAHAHLGNFNFVSSWIGGLDHAERHYRLDLGRRYPLGFASVVIDDWNIYQ